MIRYLAIVALLLATPAVALPGGRERAGGCSIPVDMLEANLVKHARSACEFSTKRRGKYWWATTDCDGRKQTAFAMTSICATQLSVENWLRTDWRKP